MHHLKSERLILRLWQDTDLLAFTAINQDPTVMQYFPSCLTIEGTKRLLSLIDAHFKRYGYGLYAVVLKESQELIGYTGIHHPTFKAHFMPCVSLGWRFAVRHWGNGYATEAAKLILNVAFNQFHFKEIVAFCPTSNIRSRLVMERLQMVHRPVDDFTHPDFLIHPTLCRYVLYRVFNHIF